MVLGLFLGLAQVEYIDLLNPLERTKKSLCSIPIIAILSLYWAVLYNVPQNLEALTVTVVSFNGQVAPSIDVQPIVG